ncbi:MAG: adhesin [Actinobacteria bacterium]|nr:MAG: adhesin [Actinomycetota bacterium]
MLKLTDTAADVIGEMIVEAELPEGAGLRIAVEGEDELSLSVEPEAQSGDTTTQDHGVTVFLDPAAADALDDKVLDAERHGDHAHFSIENQQG